LAGKINPDGYKLPKALLSETLESKTTIENNPTQVVEASSIVKPIKHKAKKGERLTPLQIAENKIIKKAEFMASPAGQQWLAVKFMNELSTLSSAKTIAEKDRILERFRNKGLKQNQFLDSLISKYEPSSSPTVGGYLAEWVEKNKDLSKSWATENPMKAKEYETKLREAMERDDLIYKGPYFKPCDK